MPLSPALQGLRRARFSSRLILSLLLFILEEKKNHRPPRGLCFQLTYVPFAGARFHRFPISRELSFLAKPEPESKVPSSPHICQQPHWSQGSPGPAGGSGQGLGALFPTPIRWPCGCPLQRWWGPGVASQVAGRHAGSPASWMDSTIPSTTTLEGHPVPGTTDPGNPTLCFFPWEGWGVTNFWKGL